MLDKAMRKTVFLKENAVYDKIDSPVGTLTIITSPKGLHAVLWESDYKNPAIKDMLQELFKSSDEKNIVNTKTQLAEYFSGKRKNFDLPLALNGTNFQQQCWQQLLKIPYAKTISYGEQAQKIGDKNKARAVGMANGLNPISIIIPCHRVIGSTGKLVGFGGGLSCKKWLLEHEARYA